MADLDEEMRMAEVKLPWKITDEQAIALITEGRRRMIAAMAEPGITIPGTDLLIGWLFDKVQELERELKLTQQRLQFAGHRET